MQLGCQVTLNTDNNSVILYMLYVHALMGLKTDRISVYSRITFFTNVPDWSMSLMEDNVCYV